METNDFELSPENSQYPEGANEAGGDSTVLESQKLSFELCKKLKAINKNDDLSFGQEKDKEETKQPQEKSVKKAYMLNHENPYMKKPADTQIVTTDNNLNDIISKIEQSIKRKRGASEMEEFFDDDEEPKPIARSNTNSALSSLAKINLKKKQPPSERPPYLQHQHKRKKVVEVKEEIDNSTNTKKSKKLNISRTEGWTFKAKKPKKAKRGKDYDAFDVFESSKDINANDESYQPPTKGKHKKGKPKENKHKEDRKVLSKGKSSIGK